MECYEVDEAAARLSLELRLALRLVWDLLRARFFKSKICSMMSTLSSTLLKRICEFIVYSLLYPSFSL